MGVYSTVHFLKVLTFVVALVSYGCGQTMSSPTIAIANSVGNGYSISLEPISVDGFDGLHSFAVAQYEGKWILFGGRTDGLHRRQPFASFSPENNNTNIIVIDPKTKQSWIAGTKEMASALNEQLQSSNMQFIQQGKTLYLIGGYGYSKLAGNHITHKGLIAVKLDGLIAAVQKGDSITSFFRQTSDLLFALTGGQIGKIGDIFYLVGGQRFDGRYNPMGPDHGPGFSQQYSEQIRKFRIIDDGNKLGFEKLSVVTDSNNLHRRDFNMLPQVFADNAVGFTVFSGVFQVATNIPFTNTVDIFADKHTVNTTFTQYLSHYHSAKVAIYDSAKQRTENIFFGGISQYEENAGKLTKNDDVPFTNVISKVTRDPDGKMTETKLGDMPGFWGASAEFLVNPNLPKYENDIVKADELKGDRILLGHIVGGIVSSQKSVFFSNRVAESKASKTIFEVWLTKKPK
ncbi:MAG: hypothetical protein WBO10_03645 [Pyrinomonadaceae bacterium]